MLESKATNMLMKCNVKFNIEEKSPKTNKDKISMTS